MNLIFNQTSSYAIIKYAKTSFPDGNLEHAYCRNPLGSRERPWCHVTGGDEEKNGWEYCQVPLCGNLLRLLDFIILFDLI